MNRAGEELERSPHVRYVREERHHWSLSVYDWTENLITDIDLATTTLRRAERLANRLLIEVPEAHYVAVWDEETGERLITLRRFSPTQHGENHNA